MKKPVIDLEKEYGLVLEGGGARGAYQIGAWQALEEAGVKIKGVAGTSVGALNGALICMGDLEKAKHLWEEISYSKVMKVDDHMMSGMFQGKGSFKDTLKEVLRFAMEGGIDITPLQQMIKENVDEQYIRNSGKGFSLLTFSFTEMKEMDLDIADIPEGLLSDFLLASAYLIFFKNKPLHGKRYMDGGIINNVPLESLVKRGYENIIMLRIFGPGREKKVELPEGTAVYSVEPRVRLGNIIDFDSRKSRRNMKIGYYDAMRFLYGLKGFIYYIEQTEEECYYLKKLSDVDVRIKEYLCAVYSKKPVESKLLRTFMEAVLPGIAQELKLGKNWTYDELYIACLEVTAKHLRIQKYEIYTVEELLIKVLEKDRQQPENHSFPDLCWLILDRVPDSAEGEEM